MKFFLKVKEKYKITAIIPKEEFDRGSEYHDAFHEEFNMYDYKKMLPKLKNLFRALNGGKLKSTVIVDFSGKPSALKDIDHKMIEALQKLDYDVTEDSYKTGLVLKDGKTIPILSILKTKATKVRGYDKLKDQYSKTKNERIKKELDFYDHIISMDILDSSKKIDIRKLSIYDNNKSKIVFSYKHRLIASQSTHVGWTSCMDFDKDISESNDQYKSVGEGASRGEFVAFLAKSGDEYTLDSPTARVIFRPYFGKATKDVIWKADKVYGTAPSSFRDFTQKLIDKVVHPKADVYFINTFSYNDDLPTHHVEKIHEMSPKEQLEAVRHYGSAIQHIKNPSERMQLEAVDSPSSYKESALKYIKNPSEKVQRAAVKRVSRAIQFIKNPPEDLQIQAVKDDAFVIQYITNPSETVQLAAVKNNVAVIGHITNPTPAVLKYVKEREGT